MTFRLRSTFAFAKHFYAEFAQDRIPAVAGGVTFFGLLALFPAIACLVSLYGLFADRAAIGNTLNHMAAFLPGGAVSIIGDELHRLTAQKPAQLGFGFLITFAIALWSSSGGIKALLDGLNIAYEVRETRSFLRITLLALCFTITGVVFLAAVVVLATLFPRLVAALGFGTTGQMLLGVLAWPLVYALCVLLLALIYRYGPDRKQAKWQWITWGSAIASALWMAGTALFSWYVQHYGSYNRTYGALGSAVGFLTWIWLSLVILLAGAEFNCELEQADRKPL